MKEAQSQTEYCLWFPASLLYCCKRICRCKKYSDCLWRMVSYMARFPCGIPTI